MTLLLELQRLALAAVGAVLLDFEILPRDALLLAVQTEGAHAALTLIVGAERGENCSLSTGHSWETLLED
jgi:hypothetical protein